MNRKHLCAVLTIGAATFATGAFAADLPSAAMAPAPYVAAPPPVFTWTGFYVGVNAGVNFNGSLNPVFRSNVPTYGPQTPGSNNTAGFTGGGQIGYNWQVSQFVYGLEADIDYLSRNNLNGTYVAALNPNAPGTAYTLAGGQRNAVTGSIRGRVGYAVDRALFYVTGGVAFGGNSAPSTMTFTNGVGGAIAPNGVFTAQNSGNSNIGEVVGGGVEYAFTPNWTGRVEYLHNFFNNRNVTYVNAVGQTYTASGYKFDTNIVRVGLNYKF